MEIIGHVKQVGKIVSTEFHPEVIEQNPVRAADLKAAKQMEEVTRSREFYNLLADQGRDALVI
tara:strand:+ start:577 stop:765 length:189 start_codon:yes stop_codon:yes gene_type:complete